jgi:hypothetical protein
MMSDSPKADDARDDFILQERLAGRSARSISKELRCTVGEVNAALDRVLPQLDNAMRLRHISLDLQRLDELLKVFFARAVEKVDAQAGLLCVKILERKSAMLGLDAAQRIDLSVQPPEHSETGHEAIKAAIMRVARGPDWRPSDDPADDPNGNGSSGPSDPKH